MDVRSFLVRMGKVENVWKTMKRRGCIVRCGGGESIAGACVLVPWGVALWAADLFEV